MIYAQARYRIKTGDCIGVKTRSIGGWFVRLGQHIAGLKWAKYGHTGIAIWVDVAGEMRLMMAEMNQGGDNYKPLSNYALHGCDIGVFEPPHDADMHGVGHVIRTILDRHIPYGWLDLVPLGMQLFLRRFVGANSFGGDNGKDQVCSYLTKSIYMELGAKFDGVPVRPAPGEVLDALKLRFEVKG